MFFKPFVKEFARDFNAKNFVRKNSPMIKKFNEVAFSLTEGEISDPENQSRISGC